VSRHAPNSAVALASVLVVGVVAGGAYLLAGEPPLPTAGGRVHLDGTASVVRADGTAEMLADGDIVHPGDEIEVTGGTLVLELAAGGTVEGRAGRAAAADTLLEVGAPVRLLAGDLLADGPSGLSVDAAGTVVTLEGDGDDGRGDGAARIARDLAVTTATYEGVAVVDSAGEHRGVAALRQLSVSSVGRLPASVDPVRTDATDPWDLRYLGEAIDLTRRLDSLSRSFTVLGSELSAGDLRGLLPSLDRVASFGPELLAPGRGAGETIVGAAITSRAAGADSDFGERWGDVFAFRDDGATWGLVALDQRVTGGDLLADVEAALGRTLGEPTDGEVASGLPSGSGSTVGTGPGGTGSSTAPSSPTSVVTVPSTPVTLPSTPPTTSPTIPPPTLPPPDEVLPDAGDVLDGLLDPIEDLVGGLL
jgi:hypothetical protein